MSKLSLAITEKQSSSIPMLRGGSFLKNCKQTAEKCKQIFKSKNNIYMGSELCLDQPGPKEYFV